MPQPRRQAAHGGRARAAVALLAATPLASACVRRLPPAPIPDAIVPAVALDTPSVPGATRLVVDVTDGPIEIRQLSMRATPGGADPTAGVRFVEGYDVRCAASPCTIDLPEGNVVLAFPIIGQPSKIESELIYVGAEPELYRRTLSVYEDHTGSTRTVGIVGIAVGAVASIVGISLLSPGLASGSDGLIIAGGINLGVGAAMLGLGLLATRIDAPTFRPGASNHVPLATATAPR
ncbi:MAG: hypothetical protein R2939_20130 [Kofleriaceae bacterium]